MQVAEECHTKLSECGSVDMRCLCTCIVGGAFFAEAASRLETHGETERNRTHILAYMEK